MTVGNSRTPFPTPTAIAVGVFCVSTLLTPIVPPSEFPAYLTDRNRVELDWSMSDFDNE